MVTNKWIAGAGTTSLSLDMLTGGVRAEACGKPQTKMQEVSSVQVKRQEEPLVGHRVESKAELHPRLQVESFSEMLLESQAAVCDETQDESRKQAQGGASAFEKTLVCADALTLEKPFALGISESKHLDLPFVCRESAGALARKAFANPLVTGAFIYSVDDMSVLNLVSMLKRDYPFKQVFLVSDSSDSWFLRRAALTLVDGIVPCDRFYPELLARHIKAPAAGNPVPVTGDPTPVVNDPAPAAIGTSAPANAPAALGGVLEGSLEDDTPEVLYSGDQACCENGGSSCDESVYEPASCADTVPLEAYAADISMLSPADCFPVGEKNSKASEEKRLRDDVYAGNLNIGIIDAPEFECDEIEEAVASGLYGSLSPLQTEQAACAQKVASAGSAPDVSRAFYLPVIGASGGVGKSTIAFLSAVCAARLGCKTLLVDLDLQFGDMALYSQVEQAISLNQLVADPCLVEQLEPVPEGFCLVGSCALPEQSDEALNALEQVIEYASGHFDVIVSNGPAFWDDKHMALLERAGKILFVLDQRISSARATQKAFDVCMRCGLAASPFLFLLNKCGRQSQLTYMDVTCATQGAPCKELPDGGRAVGEYLEARQALCLFDEGNDLALELSDLMTEILPGCNVMKGVKQGRRFSRLLFGKKHRKGDK